jgi:peptidyl-prolyl cis-trans isomerase D
MLQGMREGARSPWILVIIGLIVLSFVLTGAESLTFNGSQSGAAEVNGEEISLNELQFAIERQRRQLSELYGDQIDPSFLDDDLLRPSVLNGLIEQALLSDYAASLEIASSPKAVGRAITSNPAFQLDGGFSAEYYRDILRSNGLTNSQYRADQENLDRLQKLQSFVSEAAFVTPMETQASINVAAERRDVRYLVVDDTTLAVEGATSDDAVSAYYESNVEQFAQPERVIASYVLLTPEMYTQPVDPAEVAAQLADALAEYDSKAESEVAHILITQMDDEDAAGYQTRIDAVSTRLASGDDFAVIAQELSDDIGSASLGGDLGYTDGSVFPDAMEDAINALAIGQVSDAVETDAGTHFILLKQRTAAAQVSDEVLRAEIEDNLRSAQSQRDLLLAVDKLRDAVFTADDLESAAGALGVAVNTSAPFSRDAGEGIFDEVALREAAFADDVFIEDNNSDVIELSGSRFVALRVNERLPEGSKPLQEVRGDIIATLERQAREAELEGLVADVNAALAAGESLESIAETRGLEWRVELAATRQNTLLPPEVLQAAFAKQASDTNSVSAIGVTSGGYALVQLARVTAGSADTLLTSERQALVDEVQQVQGDLLFTEFLADLRRRGSVIVR